MSGSLDVINEIEMNKTKSFTLLSGRENNDSDNFTYKQV